MSPNGQLRHTRGSKACRRRDALRRGAPHRLPPGARGRADGRRLPRRPGPTTGFPISATPPAKHSPLRKKSGSAKRSSDRCAPRLRLVEDPEIADYVDSLGQRIAERGFEAQLPVSRGSMRRLRTRFAGPGGIIAVNTGLVMITKSESELASVPRARDRPRHPAAPCPHDRAKPGLVPHYPRDHPGSHRDREPEREAGQAAIAASVAGAQQSALKHSRRKTRWKRIGPAWYCSTGPASTLGRCPLSSSGSRSGSALRPGRRRSS